MQNIGVRFNIGAGVTGTAEIRGLSDAISAVNEKAKGLSAGVGGSRRQLDEFGQTARQAANNTRQLSAQFTDIAVSLTTGQNPFYVLLQQGGQIKDMYGGLGNAFRAVAAQIGPVGLALGAAVAVAGALAKAFNDAEREVVNFRNTAILTGNAIGLTKEQFDQLSQSVSAATGGNLPRAREVLEQLASSGRFTGEQLDLTAQTVIRLSAVSGKSADEIARGFISMRDGVAAWALKANESYGFINAAQYDHIKQLEEQGREAEAADAAMRALYDHLGSGAVSNLTTLESTWQSVKGAISGAWEALKGFTRDGTRSERIAELRAQIAGMETFTPPRGAARRRTPEEIQQEFTVYRGRAGTVNVYEQAQRELAKLVAEDAAEQAETMAAAERTAQNKRETEAKAGWDRLLKTYGDKGAQLDEAIQKIKADGQKAVAAGLTTQAEVDKLIENARKKSAGPAPKANAIDDQIKNLQDQLLKSRDLANETEALMRQAIDRGDYGKPSDAKKQELIDLARQVDLTKALNNEERQRQSLAGKAQRREDSIVGQADAFVAAERERSVQALIDEREAIGATRDELDRLAYSRRVDAQFARLMSQTTDQDLISSLREQRDALKELYEVESRRTELLRTSYGAGIRGFLADIRLQAQDNAGMIGAALSGAFNRASDALADFVLTGKLQFKDFTRSVLADMARLFAQRAVAQLVTAAFGGFGPGAGTGGVSFGGSASFLPAVPTIGSGVFHTGGIVGGMAPATRAVSPGLFSGARKYHTGGLVDGEVPIIAKRGEGVFTPAQMRALAPVDRMASGPTNVSVSVNVESGQSNTTSSDRKGEDIGRLIGIKVLEVLQYEKRPGGMLA